MPLPTVSVVVPCYNYGRYLPQAVHSVLDQPGVAVDVLIVDDCSTDGSQAVAQELADANPRVKVLLHERNAGHIATYNEGLSRARGEYVVLLSADDLLAPGSLGRATGLMRANPTVGLVYGHPQDFVDTPPEFIGRRSSWTVWNGVGWIRRLCRRGGNVILSPEAVVRTDIMRRLVGYRADMPHEADMELWLRIAAVSDVGRINGPDQAYYRDHGANMHHGRSEGLWLADLQARTNVFDTFFAEHPTVASRIGDRAHHAARRALANEALRRARMAALADGGSSASAQELAGFARQVCPEIVSTLAWRQFDHYQSISSSGALAGADRALNRIVESYRWRRWRVTGT
ncbi:glycosyltransferase family 2 protein [Microlunatus elymi]|uniref:glycosyltransferase family 2 protein n=1 Tax=Microlunatus elymi TaxID=2596828 RepID=UPI00143D6A19|nr:glycosyltransferase family 2 protein [Microlunatus elymi]